MKRRQQLFTAMVKIPIEAVEQATTDGGQLLVVLDSTWLSQEQLENMFRSILDIEGADPAAVEQHLRIANNLPAMLAHCVQQGLVQAKWSD